MPGGLVLLWSRTGSSMRMIDVDMVYHDDGCMQLRGVSFL